MGLGLMSVRWMTRLCDGLHGCDTAQGPATGGGLPACPAYRLGHCSSGTHREGPGDAETTVSAVLLVGVQM